MQPDFESIKRSTDIVAVVESHGVKLKKAGRNHLGLCPFHDDTTPSLVVTRDKGLFHCPACGAAGNVIQFVARKEGIGDKEAALKLLGSIPGVTRGASERGTRKPERGMNSESAPDGAPHTHPSSHVPHPSLLKRVVGFYARTLHKDKAGLEYLRSRNLADGALLEGFQIGYCNGSLLGALPESGEVIEGLKALGILNERGRECFYGRVTVPIFDGNGEVCGLYGRRLNDEQPKHLYLPGAHRGVWNGAAFKTHQTLLLAESIFDAMSLWCAGFRNAIALYGASGWTPDHAALLLASGVREVYLCLDNDEPGQATTVRLKEEVLPELLPSLAIHTLQWPEGVKDANAFFLSRNAVEFEALLQAANPQAQAPNPQSAIHDPQLVERTPEGFIAGYGDRRYELRAIERPGAARLKATIKALGREPGRFHIDTVDFYLSRSRRAFVSEAARLFREEVEVVEADVNHLITQLESHAANPQGENPQSKIQNPQLEAEALKLGRHPDLAGEIVRDLAKLGMVGEEVNKLLGYLVMTSRKLEEPLALLILSSSGAGKSHLQDAVLSLCPEEELIKLTSLTGQALFYKGEDSLRHKVLAIEEEGGADQAHYAIRNLISARKLTIESTIKNALTGKLETQVNTVHGPTAVFQTTTNPHTDAETRSRFILLAVDESAGQTKSILEAQRQGHTLEGLLRKGRQAEVLRRHHAFQRLLKPIPIVNPYEPLLSYPDDRLSVRRENPKYLNLIVAVTFLHQMQRPVHTHPELGEYIETTLDDIAIANEIAHALFGHSLDDLSRPARALLELTAEYARGQAALLNQPAEEIAFARRELREAIKWNDTRLRTHLDELVRMEYLLPLCGRFGQSYQYRLLHDAPGDSIPEGRYMAGLKSVEQLRREARSAGIAVNLADLAGENTDLAGGNGHLAPTSRVTIREVPTPAKPYPARANGHSPANLAPFPEKHLGVFGANGSVPGIKNGDIQ